MKQTSSLWIADDTREFIGKPVETYASVTKDLRERYIENKDKMDALDIMASTAEVDPIQQVNKDKTINTIRKSFADPLAKNNLEFARSVVQNTYKDFMKDEEFHKSVASRKNREAIYKQWDEQVGKNEMSNEVNGYAKARAGYEEKLIKKNANGVVEGGWKPVNVIDDIKLHTEMDKDVQDWVKMRLDKGNMSVIDIQRKYNIGLPEAQLLYSYGTQEEVSSAKLEETARQAMLSNPKYKILKDFEIEKSDFIATHRGRDINGNLIETPITKDDEFVWEGKRISATKPSENPLLIKYVNEAIKGVSPKNSRYNSLVENAQKQAINDFIKNDIINNVDNKLDDYYKIGLQSNAEEKIMNPGIRTARSLDWNKVDMKYMHIEDSMALLKKKRAWEEEDKEKFAITTFQNMPGAEGVTSIGDAEDKRNTLVSSKSDILKKASLGNTVLEPNERKAIELYGIGKLSLSQLKQTMNTKNGKDFATQLEDIANQDNHILTQLETAKKQTFEELGITDETRKKEYDRIYNILSKEYDSVIGEKKAMSDLSGDPNVLPSDTPIENKGAYISRRMKDFASTKEISKMMDKKLLAQNQATVVPVGFTYNEKLSKDFDKAISAGGADINIQQVINGKLEDVGTIDRTPGRSYSFGYHDGRVRAMTSNVEAKDKKTGNILPGKPVFIKDFHIQNPPTSIVESITNDQIIDIIKGSIQDGKGLYGKNVEFIKSEANAKNLPNDKSFDIDGTSFSLEEVANWVKSNLVNDIKK